MRESALVVAACWDGYLLAYGDWRFKLETARASCRHSVCQWDSHAGRSVLVLSDCGSPVGRFWMYLIVGILFKAVAGAELSDTREAEDPEDNLPEEEDSKNK